MGIQNLHSCYCSLLELVIAYTAPGPQAASRQPTPSSSAASSGMRPSHPLAFLSVLQLFVKAHSFLLYPTRSGSLALLQRVSTRDRVEPQVLPRAHDILVTSPGSEELTVSVQEGQTILDALEANNIDAPHSCRSGLCTE